MATKTDLAKKIGTVVGALTLAGLVFQAGMAYQDLKETKDDLKTTKTRVGNVENEIGAIRENLRSFGVPLDPTKIEHMILTIPQQTIRIPDTKVLPRTPPVNPLRGADAR